MAGLGPAVTRMLIQLIGTHATHQSLLIGSAYPCSAQTAQTQVSGRTGFASDSHFASLLAAESPTRRPRALRFHYLTGTFGYAFVIPSSVPSLTR
jgi:hypothetical protein